MTSVGVAGGVVGTVVGALVDGMVVKVEDGPVGRSVGVMFGVLVVDSVAGEDVGPVGWVDGEFVVKVASADDVVLAYSDVTEVEDVLAGTDDMLPVEPVG